MVGTWDSHKIWLMTALRPLLHARWSEGENARSRACSRTHARAHTHTHTHTHTHRAKKRCKYVHRSATLSLRRPLCPSQSKDEDRALSGCIVRHDYANKANFGNKTVHYGKLGSRVWHPFGACMSAYVGGFLCRPRWRPQSPITNI